MTTRKYAPVVLFVFNRLSHTQQTVAALQQNLLAGQTELFVYADAARNEKERKEVDEVRNYVRQITGFARLEVTERDTNRGLAENIIAGVTEVLSRYDRVIVLEDDLVTSPYFLTFMNEGLEKYKENGRVAQVNGHAFDLGKHMPDAFFIRFVDSWGWGTWARSWELFNPRGQELLDALEAKGLCREFDFDGTYPFTRMLRRQVKGENDSWAIRWNASLFLHNKLSLNAGKSLVRNIGFDGSGTHCGKGDLFQTELSGGKLCVPETDRPEESAFARERMKKMYRWQNSKIHKAWVLFRDKLKLRL